MIKRIAANKHFKNVSWNLADAILYPIALLIATPLYLKGLGDEVYGLWMLLTSIIVSIGVLSGGLADTTIRFVSKYRAINNTTRALKVFNSTLSLTLYLSIFILFISAPLAYGLVRFSLIEIPDAVAPDSVLLLILCFVTVSVKLVEQIFFAYFKAYEQFSVFSKTSISIRIGSIITNIALISLGYGLVEVILSTLIISLVLLAPMVIYTGSQIGFKHLWPNTDKETLQEIRVYAQWSWLQTLIGIANSQADKFLVAYLAGLEALAYYSIGLMVINQIHMVLSTGTSTVFPLISRKEALNENTNSLFYLLQQLVTVTGLLMVLHLELVQELVFSLWLGQEVYILAAPYLPFFFAFQIFVSATVVPYFFFLGSGKIKQNTYFQISNTLLMVPAMVLFFAAWGEVGLVMGKATAMLLALLGLFWYLKKKVFPREKSLLHFKTIIFCSVAILVLALDNMYVSIAFLLYLYYSILELTRKSNLLQKFTLKS